MRISLHGCAGWSASLWLTNPENRFSRVEDHIVLGKKLKNKMFKLYFYYRGDKFHSLSFKASFEIMASFSIFRQHWN